MIRLMTTAFGMLLVVGLSAAVGDFRSPAQKFARFVGADGKPVKEKPLDLHNHGMDSMRYLVRWADRRERLGGMRVEVSNPEGKDFATAPRGAFGAAPGAFTRGKW